MKLKSFYTSRFLLTLLSDNEEKLVELVSNSTLHDFTAYLYRLVNRSPGIWIALNVYVGKESNLTVRIKALSPPIVYQVESFQSTKLSDETPGKYVYYNRLPGYVLLRCADQELLFQRLVDEGILYKSWRSKVKRIEKKEVVQMLSWEFDKLKNFLESQIIPDGKKQEIDFAVGDSVMILSGPLQNVVLTIEEIYPEMKKVKMLTTFFGRYTPVEVSFDNLKKVKQY